MQQFRRMQKLVAILQERESMTVHGIARALDVSLATVRRDLTVLENDGLIVRTRGRARAIRVEINEPTMRSKSFANVDKKDAIAKYAATLVHDGDFICMDSGTTSLLIIRYITAKDVVVFTNGLQQARELMEHNIQGYMLPGMIKNGTMATVGITTINDINRFNFNACFIGANGVSNTSGYTTHHIDEANVKSAMIQRSKRKYILADTTKIDKEYSVVFCGFNDAVMITDQRLESFEYPENTIVVKKE